MPIAETIYLLLAIYGVSNAISIVKGGAIGRLLSCGIPFLKALLLCPVCVSFWVGLAASLFVFSTANTFIDSRAVSAVVDAGVAAGSVYVLHGIVERIVPADF